MDFSIFSAMIELNCVIATRASLPIMPSREITNRENFFIDCGSAYHAYPSWLFTTNTVAPPLAHIYSNLCQHRQVWCQWWLQLVGTINIRSWCNPASSYTYHYPGGYPSLIWYVPDGIWVWRVLILGWRPFGIDKEVCYALRYDVVLSGLLSCS